MADANEKDLLWLEISNVRMTTRQGASDGESGTTQESKEASVDIHVQLKADRNNPEPLWWPVRPDAVGKHGGETGKEILRALDTKRLVLAGFGPGRTPLQAELIRIQYLDSGSR